MRAQARGSDSPFSSAPGGASMRVSSFPAVVLDGSIFFFPHLQRLLS